MQQRFTSSEATLTLMREFKAMTNICIGIGLRHNVSTLMRLSLLSYRELRQFHVPSYYKLSAISRAAGILASRKKSIRRGYRTKDPYVKVLCLTSCYGFKIQDGKLRIPVANRRFEEIQLTQHTCEVVSTPSVKVRAYTLTERSLSLAISKEIPPMGGCVDTVGVDRNLQNLTVGNDDAVTYYDLTEFIRITETTTEIIGSFKRNDHKIMRRLTVKYGQRRHRRITQLLHLISKDIVENAKRHRMAIVFEDITDIRQLYRRGNGKGCRFRLRMSSWPYHEAKRQITYKAEWEGVPVITLSKSETRGTSRVCPRCGERLQSSKQLSRKLWCQRCREMFDRDLVAVLNTSRRGRVRFARSKGVGFEAMVQEPDAGATLPKVILKVDPTKLTYPASGRTVSRTNRTI